MHSERSGGRRCACALVIVVGAIVAAAACSPDGGSEGDLGAGVGEARLSTRPDGTIIEATAGTPITVRSLAGWRCDERAPGTPCALCRLPAPRTITTQRFVVRASTFRFVPAASRADGGAIRTADACLASSGAAGAVLSGTAYVGCMYFNAAVPACTPGSAPPLDAGTPRPDAGRDAGTPPRDAGTPGLDAGGPPRDAGRDAGGGTSDAATSSCAGAANGLYCGGNGVTGSAGTLYRCTGGVLSVEQVCAAGCSAQAAGVADYCVPTDCRTGTATAALGWTCSWSAASGRQVWTCGDATRGRGATGTRYRCRPDGTPEAQRCAAGCMVRAVGTDDCCN